jgi:predicted O-methyltransferase YrrM
VSTGKAQLLFRRPHEIRDRLQNKLNAWTDRLSAPCNLTAVANPSELEAKLAELFADSATQAPGPLRTIEQHIAVQKELLRAGSAPFSASSYGTATLGRLCYFTSRYLRPRVVVETGVAYGLTSTYILQALAQNGLGELYSIDLPPLATEAERHVGCLIPSELRARWTLKLGPARKLLPEALKQIAYADMFVCDSLHTYSHMKWEFETALRSLRPGGVIISDDIEGNRAFEEITRHPSIASWVAIRQESKDALCGVLRTRS